jgi:manganese/iron transport system permease protein
MSWVMDPLEFAFFRNALVAAVLMGIVCGALGGYVVLRGLAFIGDALTHSVFPGLVVAFLLGVNALIGGLVCGLLVSTGIGLTARNRRVSEDSAIGVVFAGAFALGIVLISRSRGYQRDLSSFLIGNVLSASHADIVLSVAVGALVLLALALFHKELQLVAFDPVSAAAMGYPVLALELLLLALITCTVIASLSTVGTILVLAMLVTPAATVRLVTERFSTLLAGGGALGALEGAIGLYVSWHANVSAGGAIVLVATGVFFLTLIGSPSHGLASRWVHPPDLDSSSRGEAALS